MKKCQRALTLCLLGAGFLMITLGILRGEHQAVLEKAIKICLECVGIG